MATEDAAKKASVWAENEGSKWVDAHPDVAAAQPNEKLQNRVRRRAAVGKRIGRGLISSYGKGADLKASVAASKVAAQMGKRFDDEGMTFEGYQVLSRGMDWANSEIAKKESQLRSGTMGEDEAEAARIAIDKMKHGIEFAKPHMGNSLARAAGTYKIGQNGFIDENDRKGVSEYTGSSKLSGQQIWNAVKEGSRKGNVKMAYTTYDGTLDKAELNKFVLKQNQLTWASYSEDAYKTLAEEGGAIDQMTRTESGLRSLRGLIGGKGPAAGPQQQEVIRKRLAELAKLPGMSHVDPDVLLSKHDNERLLPVQAKTQQQQQQQQPTRQQATQTQQTTATQQATQTQQLGGPPPPPPPPPVQTSQLDPDDDSVVTPPTPTQTSTQAASANIRRSLKEEVGEVAREAARAANRDMDKQLYYVRDRNGQQIPLTYDQASELIMHSRDMGYGKPPIEKLDPGAPEPPIPEGWW